MNHRKLVLAGAVATMSAIACSSVFAIQTSKLPPEKTQGSIVYLTGGIGEAEAAAMKRAESKFPLSLEFAQHAKHRDEFLADVAVTIKNQTGKTALKTTTDGPFLLAKMPAGKYTVTAEESGKIKTAHFTIAAQKPEHLVMVW